MDELIVITKGKINRDCLTDKQEEKWKDWKWQTRNSIKTVEQVEKILDIKFGENEKEKIKHTIDQFPMSITPYYLSLIKKQDYENDPVFKQAFANVRELEIADYDMKDPLAEDKDSPVEGITHRYPDRVLFHVSNVCAMYCRHCTRKRKVGDNDYIPSKEQMKKGIEYIKDTPEIRDVLLSGGDPFLLSDELIDWLLGELEKIKHVEIIRIGTRTPVVLPYRITENLIEVLKKHGIIWINTHFNHPREITVDSREALKKLAFAGIPLGNQSVLLAGVNDCPLIMRRLVHQLTANRVRPYYIYQCDLSEGLEHFRTSVGKGIEIMESLRGHTSGFAVPTYVIDAPGGGGKIPVMPNYLISWSDNKVILRNYEGVITTYHEPDDYSSNNCDLHCDACSLQNVLKIDDEESKATGVAKLLANFDEMITLTPNEEEKNEL